MTIEEGKLVVEGVPGIYCFRNTINQKCYIGQAVNLRNRFKSHMSNYKSMRYDNPLYRAILLAVSLGTFSNGVAGRFTIIP